MPVMLHSLATPRTRAADEWARAAVWPWRTRWRWRRPCKLLQAGWKARFAHAYARRRWPRVDVVRQGSRAVGEMLRLAPGVRAAVLRERGKQAFRERLSPLQSGPEAYDTTERCVSRLIPPSLVPLRGAAFN